MIEYTVRRDWRENLPPFKPSVSNNLPNPDNYEDGEHNWRYTSDLRAYHDYQKLLASRRDADAEARARRLAFNPSQYIAMTYDDVVERLNDMPTIPEHRRPVAFMGKDIQLKLLHTSAWQCLVDVKRLLPYLAISKHETYYFRLSTVEQLQYLGVSTVEALEVCVSGGCGTYAQSTARFVTSTDLTDIPHRYLVRKLPSWADSASKQVVEVGKWVQLAVAKKDTRPSLEWMVADNVARSLEAKDGYRIHYVAGVSFAEYVDERGYVATEKQTKDEDEPPDHRAPRVADNDLLSSASDVSARANVEELRTALKMLKSIAADNANRVKLSWSHNAETMTISATSKARGTVTSTVPLSFASGEGFITVNCAFLIDALKTKSKAALHLSIVEHVAAGGKDAKALHSLQPTGYPAIDYHAVIMEMNDE